jgi:outer membrane protein assembly factor BamB
MKLFKLLFCFIVFMLGVKLNAESHIAVSPWPMFQHDMSHSGQSIHSGPDITSAGVVFTANIGVSVSSPVIADDGTIYIGSTDGCLYAVFPDGKYECLYVTDGAIESAPVLSDEGIIYTGTTEGSLYAITLEGDLFWDRPISLGDTIESSPMIGSNGDIYVGSIRTGSGGLLNCVNTDGEILWQFEMGLIEYSSPAVDTHGRVFICANEPVGPDNKGVLKALSSDGRLLWNYEADDITYASPVIANNEDIFEGEDQAIYLATYSSLIAVTYNGKFKWSFSPKVDLFGDEVESGFAAPPVLDYDNLLYAAGLFGDVYCLEDRGNTVHQKWESMVKEFQLFDPIPPTVLAPPLLDNSGTIYVRAKNDLFVLNASNGESVGEPFNVNPESTLSDDLPIEAAMALGANRTLYMASTDGNLYAVGPLDEPYSISGQITGDTQKGIEVYLIGAEDRTVETDDSGRYIFRALFPGNYIVTPVKRGIGFEPPSQTVTSNSRRKDSVNFTSSFTGPVMGIAKAHPSSIANDGTTTVTFTAEILSDAGIGSVTIDLSGIGGSTAQEMNDDGDGTYSFSTVVESTVQLGLKALTVTAADVNGVGAGSIIGLQVVSEITGTVTTCREHELLIEAQGTNLNITYALLVEAASPQLLILQIFMPTNSTNDPDYELTMTEESGHHEILNAEPGTWRLIICVTDASRSKIVREYSSKNLKQNSGGQYSISSSTSGTGIVFGEVTDAEKGAPVSGVSIRSSVGGSSETDDGYYLLLGPAGNYNVTASNSDYKDATRSVSVPSGASVEANMLMKPRDFDDGTTEGGQGSCPVARALKDQGSVLSILRSFRDTALGKTDTGRNYIRKYYRFAPEVTALLGQNPGLMERVRKTALELSPLAEKVLGKEPVTLNASHIDAITDCLEKMKKGGSPGLKREIDRFILRLADRRVFSDLLAQ